MSSIRRALSRWATLSAIALSIFTSTTTSFASETGTPTASAAASSTSSFSAPFDLVASDHGQAPLLKTGWVYLPPFDFPGEQEACTACRLDDAPFLLFSI